MAGATKINVSEATLNDLWALLKANLEAKVPSEEALEEVHEVVGDLEEHVAATVVAGDIAEMAALRSRIGRLRRRTEQLEGSPATIGAISQMEACDKFLDGGRTATLMRQAAERRERERAPLARRIFEVLLGEQMRPRDIALRLQCDPTQVSRTLRTLQDAGCVRRLESVDVGADKRAVAYLSVPQDQAAAVIEGSADRIAGNEDTPSAAPANDAQRAEPAH